MKLVRFGLEHQELVLDGEDEDVGGPAREAEHDRPAAKNVSLKFDSLFFEINPMISL